MNLKGKIYQKMLDDYRDGSASVAALIDPDKQSYKILIDRVKKVNLSNAEYIFVGGSQLYSSIDECVSVIKDYSSKPVILFPGHHSHISEKADAILILSLISGRNPEYLIGQHVLAAPILYESGLEIISTGYILIDGGSITSVQKVSNTTPLSQDFVEEIVATSIAGEMLGNKLVYLEAGSGASNCVSNNIVRQVRQKIKCPLIVGGGLRTKADFLDKIAAGANIIVVGNALETNPELINEI